MSKTIVIDAGHGGKDPGACGNGLQEKDIVLVVAKKLGARLTASGFRVVYTRNTDVFIELSNRAAIANKNDADLFVSLHCNAASSASANGIETLVYRNMGENKKIATLVQDGLISSTNLLSRGIKDRPDLAVLNSTIMTAILVEMGFISNKDDAFKLALDVFQNGIADSITKSICSYFNVGTSQSTISTGTPIIAKATAAVSQAKAWAKSKNATELFISLADTFWTVAQAAGINPVLAYCQSAKETAYGRFGGVLDETYCNPCGMKNTEGGGDYDKEAHKRFNCWKDGIGAQVDHLALYTGAAGYPKSTTTDPRHFAYLLGKCKTIEELSGNWAPSNTYGEDIVKMMKEVEGTKAEEIQTAANTNGVPDWQRAAFKKLVENGTIKSPEYWEKKLLYNITVGEMFGIIANMS